MTYRFTIRQILVTMLLTAPILALIGGHIRSKIRAERLDRERLERLSKFCGHLRNAPQELENWSAKEKTIQRTPGSVIVQLRYKEESSNHEIHVELLGGRATAVSIAGAINGPFTRPEYVGWTSRGSRVESCIFGNRTAQHVVCFDLYATSLDKTKQVLQLFFLDGEFQNDLRTSDSYAPACAIRLTVEPSLEIWQDQTTDPDLLRFAELFLAAFEKTLSSSTSTKE